MGNLCVNKDGYVFGVIISWDALGVKRILPVPLFLFHVNMYVIIGLQCLPNV